MEQDLRVELPGGRLFAVRVALLCEAAGQLLVAHDRRSPDFLALLGGAVRAGEASETAARYEWDEETGLSFSSVQLVGMVENFFVWNHALAHEQSFCYRVLPPRLPATPCLVLDSPYVELRRLKLCELPHYTVYPLYLPELRQVQPRHIGHFVVRQEQAGTPTPLQ
ncbi:NUDIX domain-containing protein [Deinococcus radiophilus]|nr:NUDIX domain-containing protein [Deinococcus radiophilus]UFA50552.1 NUDIX domain-containing protein [Deinococcus radiophilus]